VSINRGVGFTWVIYTQWNYIRLKKEGNPVTCNMSDWRSLCRECSQQDTKKANTTWSHLRVEPKMASAQKQGGQGEARAGCTQRTQNFGWTWGVSSPWWLCRTQCWNAMVHSWEDPRDRACPRHSDKAVWGDTDGDSTTQLMRTAYTSKTSPACCKYIPILFVSLKIS
jgi:hypothetical protein